MVEAESMPDLARLVIKRFPENRNMQLVGFRTPATFHCSRCNRTRRAAVLAVVSGDWEQLLCSACYEEVLLGPPEKDWAGSILKEWLGSPVPVEEVEKDNMNDGIPFGNQAKDWEQFKAAMMERDEICCFCSPRDSQEHPVTTGGYALVRRGEVIKCIVTMRN
jgi:hypothetical protein